MTGEIETIKNTIFITIVVGIDLIIIYIIYLICERYEKRKILTR